MKRILGYFWRDKIDLIIFVATFIIATYYTIQDPTFDHCWTSLVTLWMFGAIYRMGFFIDLYGKK
jgi:hypothetical protein